MHFVSMRAGALVLAFGACGFLSGCGSTRFAPTDAASIHTIQLSGFAEPDYTIQGRFVLNVRGEFQNVFNRLFLPAPSLANPNLAVGTTSYAGTVLNNSGFGTITTLPGALGAPTQVRNGQIVTRFTF